MVHFRIFIMICLIVIQYPCSVLFFATLASIQWISLLPFPDFSFKVDFFPFIFLEWGRYHEIENKFTHQLFICRFSIYILLTNSRYRVVNFDWSKFNRECISTSHLAATRIRNGKKKYKLFIFHSWVSFYLILSIEE